MKNILTKTQAEVLKKGKVDPKVSYFGEIHPFIFEIDKNANYAQEKKIKVGILYLGTFMLDATMFPVFECPVCHKKEVLPYTCIASILSGAHTIKAECKACKEHIAFNDDDYYHLLRNYIMNNKDTIERVKDRQYITTGKTPDRGIDLSKISIEFAPNE